MTTAWVLLPKFPNKISGTEKTCCVGVFFLLKMWIFGLSAGAYSFKAQLACVVVVNFLCARTSINFHLPVDQGKYTNPNPLYRISPAGPNFLRRNKNMVRWQNNPGSAIHPLFISLSVSPSPPRLISSLNGENLSKSGYRSKFGSRFGILLGEEE